MTIIAPDTELRGELDRLEDAITLLQIELDQARGASDEDRALLTEAVSLRLELEDRIEAAEAEALRQRMIAEIRGKLLRGITRAGLLQRRGAIARAVRVERLLDLND